MDPERISSAGRTRLSPAGLLFLLLLAGCGRSGDLARYTRHYTREWPILDPEEGA